MSSLFIPGSFPIADDELQRIDGEDDDGDHVGGNDEAPAAGDAAVHTLTSVARMFSSPSSSSGGAAISWRSRMAATRARTLMRKAMKKSIPKPFVSSGMRKSLETVLRFDCCWCSEFHHRTEK